MKIAYIADANCNHGYRWVDYFSKENNVIIICLASQKENNLYTNHPRVKVFPILPDVFPLKNILKKNAIARVMKTILKENNSAIVHSMYAVPYSFYGHLSSAKNHIITTRGSDVFVDYKTFTTDSKKSIPQFLLKKLFENSFNKARYIAFDSYTQKTKIESFLKDKGKGTVIRMGVNINSFTNHNLTESKKNEIVIFSNRSMTALYNIHKIIAAIKIIKDKHPELKIKLKTINYYGVETYLNKIKREISDLKLKNEVEILKSATVAELVNYYFKADVVIMIPSSDGSAVSGAEAMLMKKPLIIGPIDYDKDLYNSETVWQLPDFNPYTIAKGITDLLNLPKHEILLKTEKAFKCAVENADFEKEILKLKNLYHLVNDRT